MSEDTIESLRARVDELQAACTSVENERREWKARAQSSYTYLELAARPSLLTQAVIAKEVSCEDAQAIRDEIAKAAEKADQILQDAWTQTTMAVKDFVREAADFSEEKGPTWLAFVKKWAARFRRVLGDNVPGPKKEESRERWGYSDVRDPERWTGAAKTREEALVEARSEFGPDSVIYLQRGERCTASQFVFNACHVIDDMGSAACDEVGEAAEEWPDVSKEAETALDDALEAWAYRYVDEPEFWSTIGNPERIEPEPR